MGISSDSAILRPADAPIGGLDHTDRKEEFAGIRKARKGHSVNYFSRYHDTKEAVVLKKGATDTCCYLSNDLSQHYESYAMKSLMAESVGSLLMSLAQPSKETLNAQVLVWVAYIGALILRGLECQRSCKRLRTLCSKHGLDT